jgi:hypothetical protein
MGEIHERVSQMEGEINRIRLRGGYIGEAALQDYYASPEAERANPRREPWDV